MSQPLYRQAIAHGWQLARRHPILWIYGLFASLLGHLGLFELMRGMKYAASGYSPYVVGYMEHLQGGDAPRFFTRALSVDSLMALVWLGLLLLLLAVALGVVAVVSQGALIRSAALAAKHRRVPDFGAAWHDGVRHFWRLLVVNVIKKLFLFFIIGSVSVASANAVFNDSLGDNIIFIIMFPLSVVAAVVVSFVALYAACYVVVEEYSLPEAFQAAWRLTMDHWLPSLEVAGLFIVFEVIMAMLVLVGFLLFFSPAAVLAFVGALSGHRALLTTSFGVSLVLFIGYVMVVGSLFTVFLTSAWTWLFQKMHKHGVASRVLTWFGFQT